MLDPSPLITLLSATSPLGSVDEGRSVTIAKTRLTEVTSHQTWVYAGSVAQGLSGLAPWLNQIGAPDLGSGTAAISATPYIIAALSPKHAMILDPSAAAPTPVIEGQQGLLIDRSQGVAHFDLEGPLARLALSQTCPLDFTAPRHQSATLIQTAFGPANIHVISLGDNAPLKLLVRNVYAGFVWDEITAALRVLEGETGR